MTLRQREMSVCTISRIAAGETGAGRLDRAARTIQIALRSQQWARYDTRSE